MIDKQASGEPIPKNNSALNTVADDIYDVIVIGGGTAGIAAGYWLKKKNIHFAILDAGKAVGESWKEKPDGLTLFSSRLTSSLPGLAMSGSSFDFPTKDEMTSYLQDYVDYFSLPLLHNQHVQSVTHINEKTIGKPIHHFSVITDTLTSYVAKNIIIATGAFNDPYIPSFARKLAPSVFQMHSKAYRNPQQIPLGEILLVGGGNSGWQIANDLHTAGREVMISQQNNISKIKNSGRFQFLSNCSYAIKDALGSYPCSDDTKFIFAATHRDIITLPGLTDAIDIVVFAGDKKEYVKNIIWATGYKNNRDRLDLPNIKNGSDIIQEHGITPLVGCYTLACAGRIDTAKRVAKHIVTHIDRHTR